MTQYSTGLFSRRTISWKMLFVISMMTACTWAAQYVPAFFATSPSVAVADETQPASDNDGQTSESPADDSDDNATTATDAESHSGDSDTAEGHPATEHGDDHSAGHKDPVAEVLLAILIILFLAKLSGDLFDRVGMPAVLGELTVGILLGNWALFTGSHIFDFFKAGAGGPEHLTGTVLDMLARIGVVLLLEALIDI